MKNLHYIVTKSNKQGLYKKDLIFYFWIVYPLKGYFTWYLTEELVLLCLGDDDIEDGQKMAMIGKMEFEISDTKVGKPKLPEVSESTELIDLLGPNSWTLLKVAGLGIQNVKQWINGKDMCGFEIFKSFAKNNCCVNDFAERNIRLIQDFVHAYNAEDMKQMWC